MGSPIYSYEQSKSKVEQLGCKNTILEFIFNVEDVPEIELIKQTDMAINDFMINPNGIASRLALLQETCLNRNLSPTKNLLDI